MEGREQCWVQSSRSEGYRSWRVPPCQGRKCLLGTEVFVGDGLASSAFPAHIYITRLCSHWERDISVYNLKSC